MDQYIGKMLDNRYEILERIGTGGMANVYKAKCHRLNRMVAVKILKSDLAENADFRRRFRDESRAVAQLSHANIVSVYDVSRSGDVEYIVMELIEGITLKQYMERRGQMDWREALHFIIQIMRGLSHAHSRGIIHRDIKPQNIMVLRDGSVKVADFGIACLASTGQTLTQEALGSVHYISPEQARGDRTDARSDIYSAGVVLYEMLTGKLPFDGDSAVSVAIQHLSAVPLTPRAVNPDVPEALDLICMKAMNPNPDKRYATANEMIDDLEKFRKDPGMDVEYIRADLENAENIEPTQPIKSAEVAAAARTQKNKARQQAEDQEKKNNKKLFAIIGGSFAAVLVLAILLFKIFGSFGGEKEPDGYVVPDLIGKTVTEANLMPEVKDIFEIEVFISKEGKEGFEPGQIIEQDPIAGRTRKNNLVIRVNVCPEEKMDTMPDLLNMDFEEAKVRLTNMHLDLKVVKGDPEFSDEIEEGNVISTVPAANEKIKEGDEILLVVSKGPEKKPVVVPSFETMAINDAKTEAEKLGLVVGEPQYQSSDKPEGTVLGQSVAASTTVKEGTDITFTVSSGPERKTVTFTAPDTYTGAVTVSIYRDGILIEKISVDLDTSHNFSYSFSGVAGSTATVSASIGDTQFSSQEITF